MTDTITQAQAHYALNEIKMHLSSFWPKDSPIEKLADFISQQSAREAVQQAEIEALKNPDVVYQGMMRGGIAMPSVEQVMHLYSGKLALASDLDELRRLRAEDEVFAKETSSQLRFHMDRADRLQGELDERKAEIDELRLIAEKIDELAAMAPAVRKSMLDTELIVAGYMLDNKVLRALLERAGEALGPFSQDAGNYPDAKSNAMLWSQGKYCGLKIRNIRLAASVHAEIGNLK